MRLDVWIPERTPAAERARLEALAALHVYAAAGSIEEHLGHADLLVAGQDSRRAIEVAGHLDGLRVIQTFSAGVDRIADRVPPGVTLCDASGVHDVAVSEWVLMAILASNRQLPEHLAAQRDGAWEPQRLVGRDLDGATVVIVGAGSIGRAVEARLLPFGAKVISIARRLREGVRPLSDLATVVADADVVVILLPATPETNGVVDAEILAAMRPGALLVNASRGSIVNTEALTAAVLRGHIRAALDVTDPEPLPAGHPLWSAPGTIITPHIGGDVEGEERRAWQLVFEQVGRLTRGEPLVNVVTDGY